MENNLAEWDAIDAIEVSTTELDNLARDMREQWAEYETAKKAASELLVKYEQTESRMLSLLKAAKKSKWQVDGLGTAYIINKYVVRVPKDAASKTALFNYIKEHHGPESLMGMVSINHQTLNGFVNKEKENNPEVQIPGLEAPTHMESLGFRSGK